MPQLRGLRGPLVCRGAGTRECVTNALPIDDGMSVAWGPDLRHMQEALLELLAERAEAGVAVAEEEDKQEQRGPSAGRAVPLQAPELV